MSLSEVAITLGKATSTIERAVAKLQQEGRLVHEGAKKVGCGRLLDEIWCKKPHYVKLYLISSMTRQQSRRFKVW